jgi:hypothetical protein
MTESNGKEKVSLPERARRYLAKMGPAISGSGGHTHTLMCARALVRGFLLPHSECLALLEEWNQGNEEKWSTHELEHKLRSALNGPGEDGYLLGNSPRRAPVAFSPRPIVPTPRPKMVYEPGRLQKLAGDLCDVVDLIYLANRSEVDPAGVSAPDFLARLYNPEAGERVVVFSEYKSQGQAIWPVDALPPQGPEGIWFLAQPVDGKMRPNPRLGKMSRRSEESVLSWRWMVLESDDAPLRLWLGALARVVPRIAAITTSGGRSVHALVRVDARSKAEWDQIKRKVLGLVMVGADPGALSAVRLTRLPACWRGQKEQKLLYFAPAAPALTISEMLPRRDVVAFWRGECHRVAADGFQPVDVARVLAGARHYARFDSWLGSAVQELAGVNFQNQQEGN